MTQFENISRGSDPMNLDKIRNPILFQGNLKKRQYFEGWYFKQVSDDEKTVVSLIPGISLDGEKSHAFVQYIFVHREDDTHKVMKTGYIRYPLHDFEVQDEPFLLKIGENVFTRTLVIVKLKDDNMDIQGKIALGLHQGAKKTFLEPSIMGIFAYIPKMECYHGLVSMTHRLNGTLKINGSDISFENGKGYIEKDWGTSFPKDYIWIQSNHFSNPTTSLFFSIAHIPFHLASFRGFICNLVIDGKEYRFASYNRSKVHVKHLSDSAMRIVLENKKAKLSIGATIENAGNLIAPVRGSMKKVIKEGLSGVVTIDLLDKGTGTTYSDRGIMAGIEIVR